MEHLGVRYLYPRVSEWCSEGVLAPGGSCSNSIHVINPFHVTKCFAKGKPRSK